MLILVTWVVVSLSLLAVVLGVRSVFVLGLSQRMERELQARYIAMAGIQWAVMELSQDSPTASDGLNESWRNNEAVFLRHPVGQGTFTLSYIEQDPLTQQPRLRYGFTDEGGKLSLNTAPPDVLKRFFSQAHNVTEDEAEVVADSIVDWRDQDKDKQPEGAESFYYLVQDPSYECKDAPFENVEELLFIRGMTPELMAWAFPRLTVYGSGRVNLNTADRVVLKALGLSDSCVNGIVFYRAGEDNIEGTADDRMLASSTSVASELAKYCSKEDLSRLAQLDSQQLLAVGSTAFELQVTAQVGEDSTRSMRIRAVMDRQGKVLSWAEG